MAYFRSLYSGSSGNCGIVADGDNYICIDMGKSCKATIEALSQAEILAGRISGILVTHEHSDHIGGLKVFLKKYKIPVYASDATLDYLAEYDLVPPSADLIPLAAESDCVGEFEICSFATSHDSVDCHGYKIATKTGRTVSLATDLGIVTENVFEHLSSANLAVIEANYDEKRLWAGSYPHYLKTRIASNRGHLCNSETAKTLKRLVENGNERFALCHLSNENNTPQLALEAIISEFMQNNITPSKESLIKTLNRNSITDKIEF